MGDFGPFENCDEWGLASWLMQSGASQMEIDKFLKLNIVHNQSSSFGAYQPC